jgi:hypothetical protein
MLVHQRVVILLVVNLLYFRVQIRARTTQVMLFFGGSAIHLKSTVAMYYPHVTPNLSSS